MLCNSLLVEQITDPELLKIVQTILKQSLIINSHIEFMKDYESLGIQAPSWQNAYDLFEKASAPFFTGSVRFENNLENLEIYADPLIEKVMYNLCDNAMKYGVNLTYIHSYYQPDGETCLIIVEDDGIGIQKELKAKIFEKGFGKTSGLGLFFIKEILSITNIAIRETGIQDNGARFELIVPAGNWRVRYS
ncbi:ATP-binding protein [uncultured Methanospirillum sp.]|uniref:sensor histidine kinase n=1 Tax=uncultured Methanospirillum sp. TaxID=262503 RepID=UPI0029C84E68|nr:ATP-binding protein [uncultured Methanospirillum sp.]